MKEIEAWLARDNNGNLYAYTENPKKSVRPMDCTCAEWLLEIGRNVVSRSKMVGRRAD